MPRLPRQQGGLPNRWSTTCRTRHTLPSRCRLGYESRSASSCSAPRPGANEPIPNSYTFRYHCYFTITGGADSIVYNLLFCTDGKCKKLFIYISWSTIYSNTTKIIKLKSALTDHATQENHVINWSQVTVIDREPERFTRWIKEAKHIRKEGQQAMNRDEGSYQLSHAYDRFLDTASSHCVKNRKN